MGFVETRARFSTASLRARIVASNYAWQDELPATWSRILRGGQVLHFLQRHRLKRWRALYDNRNDFTSTSAKAN
jgi:hypothetical protein